jgi:hypothetical protein
MRTNPQDKLRRLGATVMVVAYALCVFAPAAAFAQADRESIEHVLSESRGGMLVLHFHEHNSDRRDHPLQRGAGPPHLDRPPKSPLEA